MNQIRGCAISNRSLSQGRNLQPITFNDVQRVIDINPSIVNCYRKSTGGDGVHSPRGARTLICTFQGRIDFYIQRLRNIEEHSPPGSVTVNPYVLITRPGSDINGNVINVQQGDWIFDTTHNNQNYRVVEVITYNWKTDYILEIIT